MSDMGWPPPAWAHAAKTDRFLMPASIILPHNDQWLIPLHDWFSHLFTKIRHYSHLKLPRSSSYFALRQARHFFPVHPYPHFPFVKLLFQPIRVSLTVVAVSGFILSTRLLDFLMLPPLTALINPPISFPQFNKSLPIKSTKRGRCEIFLFWRKSLCRAGHKADCLNPGKNWTNYSNLWTNPHFESKIRRR